MIAAVSLFFIALSVSDGAAQLSASYKYNLANFSGDIHYMQAILAKDNVRNEVYVMNPRKKDIRIFGETGMEIYRFGDEGEFSWALDLAVDNTGHIYFLNNRYKHGTDKIMITRCNFRGEQQSEFFIQRIPEEYSGLSPVYMVIAGEKIYLADPIRLSIIVADLEGNFVKGYNVQQEINKLEEEVVARKKEKGIIVDQSTMTADMTGFDVDRRGNMYFTVAPIFTAFMLSPDGELRSWGKPGGTAGSFGVVAGIAVDDMGYIYVTDRLRCAVIVFDKNFDYITEFGFRGSRARNLIVPDEIVVTRDGRLYVAQAANRGVSVFTVSHGRGNE
jgi:hypothetical protein